MTILEFFTTLCLGLGITPFGTISVLILLNKPDEHWYNPFERHWIWYSCTIFLLSMHVILGFNGGWHDMFKDTVQTYEVKFVDIQIETGESK